jgi:hypothetical protein
MGKFVYAAKCGSAAFIGILLATAAYADPGAWDGPFGVQMGLSRSDLEAVIHLTPQYGIANEFVSKTAPRPNQGFVSYFYKIAPGAGLCRVRSETKYGPVADSDRSFEALFQRLSKKYGKPTSHTDMKDALWDSGPLPKDVATLTLARARKITGGTAVQVSYRFRNAASCEKPPVVDGKRL